MYRLGIQTFRRIRFAEFHFAEAVSPNGRFTERTFRRTDVSPNGRFAERTFHRKDVSPKGRFAESISPKGNFGQSYHNVGRKIFDETSVWRNGHSVKRPFGKTSF